MFTPKNGLSKTYNHYIEKIRNSNSVSVHIRRGDYEKLGICLDISYYKKALKLLNSKYDNLIYFVFSDNVEYAKHLFEEIDGIFVYIKKLSSDSTLDDFFLMKECKHNIIANSSYSWWAAWLNENPNKIVIHPNDKKLPNDFYPNEWITVD